MPVDDNSLMRRVQAGEHQCFNELVIRYRQAFLRVAESKLSYSARAEDVVQETFLAVFAARDSFDPSMSFRAWAWTILLNLCRRDLKRQSSTPTTNEVEVADTDGQQMRRSPRFTSVLQEVLVSERNKQLQIWLRRLPENQADALRLRFFAGLKFQEIAEAMQCSLNAAKMRVKNGLLKLANWAQQYEPLDTEGDIR